MKKAGVIKQFSKYFLTGATAIFVHYSIMYLLLAYTNLAASSASSIGFVFSIPVNFFGQRQFVFQQFDSVFIQLMLYFIGLTLAGLLNMLIIYLAVDRGTVSVFIGQLTSSITLFLFNYFYNKYITFGGILT